MIEFFVHNPLLLLFTVAAIGYPLGRIKVAGNSLGVAAVLFVGLAFGALHPDLKLPEIVYLLGLVLFVYTVGLSSGAGFFRSFRSGGIKANLLVAGGLGFAAVLSIIIGRALGLDRALTAGLYSGSLTNTPALAAVIESLKSGMPRGSASSILDLPVIGYSITYPMGVIGMILAISLLQRLWKIDYQAEVQKERDVADPSKRLHSATVRVTHPEAVGKTLQELAATHQWDIVFGRMRRGEKLSLALPQRPLEEGDLITAVGHADDVDFVTQFLGEPSDERLEFDRSQMETRRVFVSNPKVAGHRLDEINLPQQFGTMVTRVRRGDVELLPKGETVLELGDQVRILAHRDNMDAAVKFLGDSYRALTEIDILTFSLGIGVGLILGTIPFPLPGGTTVELGYAGGPLVVALILGALGRTGPVVWALSYSANLTLRQVGLILFLAGIGTRAGRSFITTFMSAGGLKLFVAGTLITTLTAIVTLSIGYKLLRIPMGRMTGVLAGLQTQPALLSYASEQSRNEIPNMGYATVYPVAIILKIVIAQLVLSLA
ncbi:MAG: aspartate:alanine exchanger family transporter [Thermoanaerobaculia bacterium]